MRPASTFSASSKGLAFRVFGLALSPFRKKTAPIPARTKKIEIVKVRAEQGLTEQNPEDREVPIDFAVICLANIQMECWIARFAVHGYLYAIGDTFQNVITTDSNSTP